MDQVRKLSGGFGNSTLSRVGPVATAYYRVQSLLYRMVAAPLPLARNFTSIDFLFFPRAENLGFREV